MMLEVWWYRGKDRPTDADDARYLCALCKKPSELTLMAAKVSRADADDACHLGASCQRQAELMLMMLVVFLCPGQLILMMLTI